MLFKKVSLVIISIVLIFSFVIMIPLAPVSAAPTNVTCVNSSGDTVPCEKGYAPLTSFEAVFANALNVITTLAGFAVLLMLVIGAFRYMTAQGDQKAVSAARSHLTWALAGLFFIIVAWLIIQFIASFTGLSLTQFKLDLNP